MSIIVMDIDLPKNKDEYTIIRIYGSGRVWADKTLVGQATQIDRPHGRLIDEEKILSPIMCKPKSLRLDDNAQYNIITLIADAPTIIEAEE